MKVEISKKDNVFEAKFDNGDMIATNDKGEGQLPSEVEAKMFVGMISEYILHYLTNEGYNEDQGTSVNS